VSRPTCPSHPTCSFDIQRSLRLFSFIVNALHPTRSGSRRYHVFCALFNLFAVTGVVLKSLRGPSSPARFCTVSNIAHREVGTISMLPSRNTSWVRCVPQRTWFPSSIQSSRGSCQTLFKYVEHTCPNVHLILCHSRMLQFRILPSVHGRTMKNLCKHSRSD
jgi:hypothetical protein